MSDAVVLYGYRYSVYTRIACMALRLKCVPYEPREVNPFDSKNPQLGQPHLHPFGRVPVLSDGGYTLFETSAITRYVDSAFDGPDLMPPSVRAQGRVHQVIAILDNYGYWPMVRQVFAHRVFRPLVGETPSEAEIAAGLSASLKVLETLNQIASEGLCLTGKALTLADCHLAPMLDYFLRAKEGEEIVAVYPALIRWWAAVQEHQCVRATDPDLSALT